MAGEGLVQAMRSVPLEFFAEDFSLQRCLFFSPGRSLVPAAMIPA